MRDVSSLELVYCSQCACSNFPIFWGDNSKSGFVSKKVEAFFSPSFLWIPCRRQWDPAKHLCRHVGLRRLGLERWSAQSGGGPKMRK